MPTGRAKDNLRLRGEPKYEALEIGFIRMTEAMEVLAISGDWLKVRFGDKEGFVMRKFVLISDDDLAALRPSAIPAPQAKATTAAPEAQPKPRPKRTSVKSSQK